MIIKKLFRNLFLICLILIAGCSNSPTSPSGQGQIRLILVDSPAGFDQVNIVVKKVEVHGANSDVSSGWMTVNDTIAVYDLLTLTNGVNSILGDKMLPAGKYTQIRLSIGSGSNVVIDGVTYALDISSATGLKLNHNFDIEEGKLYLLTLDFDAARSIKPTNNGQYRLHPVIRVVANVVSGSISGIISPASIRSMITTTVNAVDTVSTVSDAANGSFKLVALPEGTYDVTIAPLDTAYPDTIITGVQVVAQEDNNIGIVILSVTP
nr:DUF4382 domain-containing protein [candidate division Zixibacteria bacterium]